MHTPTTSILTLSLHDALPILILAARRHRVEPGRRRRLRAQQSLGAHEVQGDESSPGVERHPAAANQMVQPDGDGHEALIAGEADRKSTRLNSSHSQISYAVFC